MHQPAIQCQGAGTLDCNFRGRHVIQIQGLFRRRAEYRIRDSDLRLHDRRCHPIPARRWHRGGLARGSTFHRCMEQYWRAGSRDLQGRQRRSAGSRPAPRPGRAALAADCLRSRMASRQHPSIIITADAHALAETAAKRMLDRIGQAKGRAAICLTGGSSPERLYQLLAIEPYRSSLPWDRVHWFVGDDRFVPINDPLSNMGKAQRIFLDHVVAPASNIHPMMTDMTSLDAAAHRYAAELREKY